MIENQTVTAIILVAGNSTRYGQNRNKNFDKIGQKEVLLYSLNAFNYNKYIDEIIIGAKKEEFPIIESIIQKENLNKPFKLVVGGKNRQASVYNCIQETNSDIVIIHDGARPYIKQNYINNCLHTMNEYSAVTIGVHSKDTIKITDENALVTRTTQRSNTWIIQTPQCFKRDAILQMHEKFKFEEATDDCMLMEKGNYKVKILEGDYTNIKITTFEDLSIIKKLMEKRDN